MIESIDACLESQGWTTVRTGRNLQIDLTPERVRRRYNSQSLARKVTELQAGKLRRVVVTEGTVWRKLDFTPTHWAERPEFPKL